MDLRTIWKSWFRRDPCIERAMIISYIEKQARLQPYDDFELLLRKIAFDISRGRHLP